MSLRVWLPLNGDLHNQGLSNVTVTNNGATVNTNKSLTGTIIYFNGWTNATNYTLENTKLSDFRIYATALSAQDILSLYHNSALVDEQGIVHGAIH